MVIRDDSILQLYHERYGHQDKQHIKSIIEKELKSRLILNYVKLVSTEKPIIKNLAQGRNLQKQENRSLLIYVVHLMNHFESLDTLQFSRITTLNLGTVIS